jgi:hypothetical protein
MVAEISMHIPRLAAAFGTEFGFVKAFEGKDRDGIAT